MREETCSSHHASRSVVLALVDAFAPPQRAVAPSIILHGSKVGVYYAIGGPKYRPPQIYW